MQTKRFKIIFLAIAVAALVATFTQKCNAYNPENSLNKNETQKSLEEETIEETKNAQELKVQSNKHHNKRKIDSSMQHHIDDAGNVKPLSMQAVWNNAFVSAGCTHAKGKANKNKSYLSNNTNNDGTIYDGSISTRGSDLDPFATTRN